MTTAAASAALVCLLALPPAGAAQDHGPAGRWLGAFAPASGDPSNIEIELARGSDGRWSGSARYADGGGAPQPLTDIAIGGREIHFAVPTLAGAPRFAGLWADELIEGSLSLEPPPPLPATDIHLLELGVSDSAWELGTPVNITDREGYDNQPHFLLDDSAILYTSIRHGQADIYRYDVETGERSQLTRTLESEYSPTPLPSGDGFSTVRVEADDTQRLWGFDLAGGEPVLLLPDVAPVGYHAWLDAHRVGLFVLGSPPTLEIADLDRQTSSRAASEIGRSIHRATCEGCGAVSFVHKASETDWTIDVLELEGSRRSTLIETRPGSEDFTWAPDGSLVMGEGSSLWVSHPKDRPRRWQPLADLAPHGLDDITRLDVSGDFRWLALVAGRPQSGPPPERESQPLVLRRVGSKDL